MEIGDKLFTRLEAKVAQLEQKVGLLAERLSEYKISFSAEHHNHIRRLN